MFVWKVKYAAGEVSLIVNDSYTVTSETLSGALKKAKRLDDELLKECHESGINPDASIPIGVELICKLDD